MKKQKSPSILIVGGGYLQLPAVRIAHSLGLQVIITDRDPQCACSTIADELILLDTRDYKGHAKLGKELSKSRNLKAVFTEGASVELSVAEAAAAANLPGLNPEIAYTISNKEESRAILTRAGLPQPLYREVHDPLWRDVFKTTPVILKATDASGSKGLRKFHNSQEISEQDLEYTRQFSTDGHVLAEQFLKSDLLGIVEQSVETLWVGGKPHWLNWVDRPFEDNKQYAIELGHYNPAMQPVGILHRTQHVVEVAGRALGMKTGILKFDVLQTSQCTYILETTARLSGGFDAQET